MPTRRVIDPLFWQSESLAKVSREDRFFFLGLISNADDQGRIRAHPAILRAAVYPFDDIPFPEIERQIEALAAIGCIHIYQIDGKEAIQIVNWWRYQTPQWAYPSKIPPPAGWIDRLRYRSDNKVIDDNWDKPGGFEANNSNNGYTNLPKDLGKALPKDEKTPIRLGLELKEDSKEPDGSPHKMPDVIPGVQIHVEETGKHTLSKVQWAAIQDTVGTDPPALERWRQVCRAWAMHGNKPNNLVGLFEWFKAGIPDYAQEGKQNNGHQRNNGQSPGKQPAGAITKRVDVKTGRTYWWDSKRKCEVPAPA